MVDNPQREDLLENAWLSLGKRIAAGGGCFVAVLALLFDAPPFAAALRGGATWFALSVATRLGAIAIRSAHRCDLSQSALDEPDAAGDGAGAEREPGTERRAAGTASRTRTTAE